MMLLTALLAVAAAVFGGLARGGIRQRTLVIVSLAAPVGIMIGLSLWVQWRGRRRSFATDLSAASFGNGALRR